MEYIIGFLLIVLAIIIILGALLGIGALVIWGIGNGIICLFALPFTWTYLQSYITMFIIWGIRFIFKNFIFKSKD